ncbi:hypothetical protein BDP55DRAFT_638163 [Colletotrichum godetiae]|uniref:Xylanolytic transcriptional activator regulatory domain-containing protein n=1 Tax=Colletotrichum godetiae TaxID=1209918 RepID=A0AAJ0A7P2_9PEZI|nr:uncharacterized protein BDP55DRAFT_638163 [Colletotrichum godetiae]KAK1658056.1 hypothetical protein BDP55DRAFT_638163 [Colletotrichum godetiae]
MSSSQLRIQSILSPVSDSDDAPTGKRRRHETFLPWAGSSTSPAVEELTDRQAPGGARLHSSAIPDDNNLGRRREAQIKCDTENTGSSCDTCIKPGHKSLAQEVLSAPYLTVDLWHQLSDIYKLHFATELPFLHVPTLTGIIHDKDNNKPSTEPNLILLGILALTARFQPDWVKYVAHITHDKIADPKSRGALPRPEPSMASEYFANVLTKALGPLESALTTVTVVNVQTFLMLGVYQWSQPNGGRAAWMYVGVAIRMAQALKLGFEDKPLNSKRALAPSPCFAGGRYTESLPPWDKESAFNQLRVKVDAFYTHLPEKLTWSTLNFWKHDSSLFVSLHMLRALCKIMLHREYIPFIAIKCSEPSGTLDEPMFDSSTVPDDFWERSAERVFKAGREIVDLVSACRGNLLIRHWSYSRSGKQPLSGFMHGNFLTWMLNITW